MIRIREVLVHHLPAGPPLSARLAAAWRRATWRLSAIRLPRAGRSTRRLAVGLGFTVLLTGLVLTVPVVSSGAGGSPGHNSTPVALDAATTSSSAQSEPSAAEPAGAVVVLGIDGAGSSSSSSSSAGSPAASGPAAGPSETSSAESASSSAPAAGEAPTTSVAGTSSASPAATARTGQQPAPSTPSSSSSSTASSSASSSAPQSTPSTGPANAETHLAALVALARSRAGCTSSDVDTSLADLAKQHSKQMRGAGALAPLDNGVVAKGSTDLDAVVQAWLTDAGDRAALLDCSATTLGVGVANGSGGPWYTLALA